MPDHGHPVREAHHSLPGHGIEPVLNPILVALAVGEVLTPLALLGGAIVFISVMVYNVLNLRLEKAASGSSHPGTRPAQQKGVAPC